MPVSLPPHTDPPAECPQQAIQLPIMSGLPAETPSSIVSLEHLQRIADDLRPCPSLGTDHHNRSNIGCRRAC
ncbi:hypothetical protein PAXINDRAFT_84481 [Paxillus involutus ATCC 200175]|uniref:Uncharacterized protein n=1 Tax=Paxillus involutus ATCC 200175 TaxID=664439 RepID=A0A0C9TVY4_PAXIN|nr:hypothetical protein PAXINDRAFT_84481 [Paxillus involutus ATCC 200175]